DPLRRNDLAEDAAHSHVVALGPPPDVTILSPDPQVDLADGHRPARAHAEPALDQLGLRERVEDKAPRRFERPNHRDLAVRRRRDLQLSGDLHVISYRLVRRGFLAFALSSSSSASSCSYEAFQNLRYSSSHAFASARGAASRRRGRRWASRAWEMSPAFSSTLRCFDIAGWLIAKG